MSWRLRVVPLLRRADWRDEVSAYLDGELSPAERIRVEGRLASSDEMRAYLADLEQMRSVLKSLEPTAALAPFQLTTEMLGGVSRTVARPSQATRALRLSMTTAAVGVATFGAVMIFDVIDSPTVRFATSSADDASTLVPTAQVVTDSAQAEAESEASAEAAPATVRSVTVFAAPADGQAMEAEVEEQPQMESAFIARDSDSWQEREESAQWAELVLTDEQAAVDPARRALTSGTSSQGHDSAEAEEVTAADVVERPEQSADAEAMASIAEDNSAAETSAGATAETDDAEPTSDAAPTSSTAQASSDDASERADAQSTAGSSARSSTQVVTTSVRQVESDWPLEQRPRSGTVVLATDPSWERPVQIALAVIAIGATVVWLALTIVDRRRRT